jgi:hypothetical protein
MIWKDKTHEFTATVCMQTGRPCPAMARILRALTRSVASSAKMCDPNFLIEGSIDLDGCAHECTARYSASSARVRMYCNAGEEVAQPTLDRYADLALGQSATSIPTQQIRVYPCALSESRPLQMARVDHQPSL